MHKPRIKNLCLAAQIEALKIIYFRAGND